MKNAKIPLRLAEGFADQILHILPLPYRQLLSEHPLSQALYCTSIGYYPHAKHHYRERPEGCPENILLVCTKGSGWVEIDGRRQSVKPHHAMIIPRECPHVYAANERDPWTIYWCHFLGYEGDTYCSNLPAHHDIIPISATCEEEIMRQFTRGYAAISRDYAPANLIHLSQIIRGILSTLFFQNLNYSPHLRIATGRDVLPSMTYIADHCEKELTLKALAKQAHMSERTYIRLFHQQVGLSPINYVIQQRMKKACQLLMRSTLSVTEIARQTGYADPYYFSRVFHKEVGQSPRHYRSTLGSDFSDVR